MKLTTLAAGVLAALALPAFAAISPGITTSGTNAAYNGEGELFLSVFDSDAKVSYTFDLGVTQTDFFNVAQSEDGYSRKWAIADANVQTFLGQVNASNLRWSVLAIDQTGGSAPGAVRLFATMRNGDEGEIANLTNQNFSNGMGSSQAGTFFNAVNLTGTHGASGQAPVYANNGSSVNRDADSGNSYYGDGSVGLSTTLNNRATFNMGNAVGEASAFYYITRSSTDPLGFVTSDLFDNTTRSALFDLQSTGNGFELNYTLAAAVPEPGTWALMLAGFAAIGASVRRRTQG